MYIDYNVDESYSPKKIVIRAGAFYHDLKVPSCSGRLRWRRGLLTATETLAFACRM